MAKKKTVDLLLSRSEDSLEYHVCQVSTDGEAAITTRIIFEKGTEPDTLLGAMISLCAAAGADPFKTAIRLAEYLFDDEDTAESVKAYVHENFDKICSAIEQTGKHEPKDEPKADAKSEHKEKTVSYEELMDYIKQIFG